MKVSKLIVAGFVLMAVVVCWGMTAHAGPSVWPNQKGEICVYNENTYETARIAVMKTVGNNYIVQGINAEEDGTTLFDGNAVKNGNTVLMNLSGSGYNNTDDKNEVHGFVGRVELNLETGSGWVKMVGFHCEGEKPELPTDPTGCEFSNDGTQQLSIVDCE